MNRKEQRNNLDMTNLRELSNLGDGRLSLAGKRLESWGLKEPKLVTTEKIEVKFLPLEEFSNPQDRLKERYLLFEQRCTHLNADFYVSASVKGRFPESEIYSVVFFKIIDKTSGSQYG